MIDEKRQGHQEELLWLDHVLHSRAFSSSHSIRHILKFIVERSLAGASADIKEYTIATEALGRPSDFDPKTDNIVRMQMQRLRRKLDEYYKEEGAKEPLRIVIPRGHYIPSFQTVQSDRQPTPDAESRSNPQTLPPTGSRKVLVRGLPWGLAVGLAVIVLVINTRLSKSPAFGRGATKASTEVPTSLASLWKPFLPPNSPPLIVYSNASLMMNDAGDLYRYFLDTSSPLPVGAKVPTLAGLDRQAPIPPGVGPLYYFDLYTGTGEVIAAAKIAQLLARQNQEFSIKRSRMVSFDDLRNDNVIFIGASLENSLLRQLPVETDLTFEQLHLRQFMGSQQIRDSHPEVHQAETYHLLRDAKTGKLDGEYALISLLPGTVPAHYIMVLGGISTVGTQAAAEFASSPESMALLEKMWPPAASAGTRSSFFQALLKIEIRDGAAAKTDCLFVRELRLN